MGELEFERGQRDLKDIFPSLSPTHGSLVPNISRYKN
jgi:hypothetical protein